MIVEDIVRVVDQTQNLSIDVIMQEDVEGIPQTYSMTWEGMAQDVPLSIMRTSVRCISVDRDSDCCCCDGLKIISEM